MRFFLDNCLAIRHARALEEMVKPEHSFTHLQDKFKPSTKDEEWILGLGEEGNWIVISGDYRIGKNAHERAAWHTKWAYRFLSQQRLDKYSASAATLKARAHP